MANEEFVEKLIKERYCVNEEEKQNDTWNNICRRVSYYLGKSDKEVDIFYDMMYRKDFLPNSPTLMNAARNIEQRLRTSRYNFEVQGCVSTTHTDVTKNVQAPNFRSGIVDINNTVLL